MSRVDEEANLFGLFAVQAGRTPDACAVVAASGNLTYRQLLEQANKVRAGLHALALSPEEPVGVCMARTGSMVAGMLGILGAGGAYVPMDPATPPERLRRIVDNSQCRRVLADQAALTGLAAYPDMLAASTVIPVEAMLRAGDGDSHLPSAAGGDRRAYIIYTSGSTGIPKGVDIAHRGAVNLLFAMRDLIGFGAQDRILAAATTGFDVSVVELFLPLITGGSLLLRDRSIWLAPDELAKDIEEHAVTVVQASASTWSALLAPANRLPRVRVALNMGEAIPVALAIRLAEHAEHVWNLYGPTECSVYCAAHRLSADPTLHQRPGGESAPIGFPIDNVPIHILDENNEVAGPGVKGELCVAGIAPGRGYYNDPVLTGERFRVHEGLGQRLYYTGDLAARAESGLLTFHGRIDDQLKIRGMRIEPGEIEAALTAYPPVGAAAVTWYTNPDGFPSVVAALVATHRDVEAIRQFLAPRLPSQMIPSRYLFVDSLPTGVTGKIDRRAIRTRALLDGSGATPAARPAIEATPESLAALWQEILQVPEVHASDDFFAIGGDSLAAMRLMQAVESTYGLALPLQVIFEASTLEGLAARIDSARAGATAQDSSSFVFPLVQAGTGAPLFFAEADVRLAKAHAWTAPCALYAVAHWALGDALLRAGSLIELAGAQLAAMRKIQPHGPYRLAGYSFGGLMAYEAAQQLRREGQEVELLFLVDPMAPGKSPRLAGALPLRLFDSKPGRWLLYKSHHSRKPSAVSQALLPLEQRPDFWFSTQRLATGYRARPCAGPVQAVFSDPARRTAWRSILGAESPLPMLETGGNAAFEEPAFSRWMADLSGRIEELDADRKA